MQLGLLVYKVRIMSFVSCDALVFPVLLRDGHSHATTKGGTGEVQE